MIVQTKATGDLADPMFCSIGVRAKMDNGDEFKMSFEALPADTLSAVLNLIRDHRQAAHSEEPS